MLTLGTFLMLHFSKILLLFILFVPLYAKEYAVVVSFKSAPITQNKIKALFLKKSSFIGEKKIVPLNLALGSSIRKSFERKVLHMSLRSLQSYWTREHYLGVRPPISMQSQKSMQAFIKNVSGAIGYVRMENIDSEMYIVYKWSDE